MTKEQFSLLTIPIELQLRIFIHAQNPLLAIVCRHFQTITNSSSLKAKYIIYRYGHKSALSERSVRRKIVSRKVIELLLNHHGCDPIADEFWLYKHSCTGNHIQVCKWIIDNVNKSKIAESDRILSTTAAYGSIDAIDMLVQDYNMDIHQPDGKELALQIATARNNMPIVKHLVEKYNCDIHVDNETFLRLASFSGYSDLVSYFLNKGANVHARDNASLAGAVYRGNSSVVEILLKAGAPANVHNNLWARYASVRRQDISVLRLLISVGGLSPRFDNDLMLIKGCRNGLMGLLNFLFTDVMAKDAKSMANIKNGVLLEEAIIHKQIHVIQLLLSFGADVYSNGCLNGLYYILHSKITKTTKQIVELLESYGFDVATQDDTFQKLLLQLLYI